MLNNISNFKTALSLNSFMIDLNGSFHCIISSDTKRVGSGSGSALNFLEALKILPSLCKEACVDLYFSNLKDPYSVFFRISSHNFLLVRLANEKIFYLTPGKFCLNTMSLKYTLDMADYGLMESFRT